MDEMCDDGENENNQSHKERTKRKKKGRVESERWEEGFLPSDTSGVCDQDSTQQAIVIGAPPAWLPEDKNKERPWKIP